MWWYRHINLIAIVGRTMCRVFPSAFGMVISLYGEVEPFIHNSCSDILERSGEIETICLVVDLVKRAFVDIEIPDN